MKSVVISLPHARTRRARIAQRFAEVDLPFTFMDGIDARDLSVAHKAQLDTRYRRSRGLRPVSPGELACWLSHRAALRVLVAGNETMAAIFEDDGLPLPGLPEVLRALEERAGSFDAVVLGRRQPWKPLVDPVALGDRKMGRIRYNEWGAEGYVITRAAAGFLLARMPRMRFPYDMDLCHVWVNRLNLFFLDEPVVHHEDDYSYIDAAGPRSRYANRRFGIARIKSLRFSGEMAVLKRYTFPRLRRGGIATKRDCDFNL